MWLEFGASVMARSKDLVPDHLGESCGTTRVALLSRLTACSRKMDSQGCHAPTAAQRRTGFTASLRPSSYCSRTFRSRLRYYGEIFLERVRQSLVNGWARIQTMRRTRVLYAIVSLTYHLNIQRAGGRATLCEQTYLCVFRAAVSCTASRRQPCDKGRKPGLHRHIIWGTNSRYRTPDSARRAQGQRSLIGQAGPRLGWLFVFVCVRARVRLAHAH